LSSFRFEGEETTYRRENYNAETQRTRRLAEKRSEHRLKRVLLGGESEWKSERVKELKVKELKTAEARRAVLDGI
jgi:hypothetical protein